MRSSPGSRACPSHAGISARASWSARATFFDAFDALSLAFVLPVLVPSWGLSRPARSASLIAIGYLGQFLGALIFGSPGRVASDAFAAPRRRRRRSCR